MTTTWKSSLATEAMHFSPAWRNGYNDAVRGYPCQSAKFDGDSSLLYFDGWNVGAVNFRVSLMARTPERH